MRKIIMSTEEEYDMDRHKKTIDRIIDKFVQYLETYKPKSGGIGLTTLLGPVGKVLNKIKSEPDINFEPLIGFGVRAHEMSMNFIDHASLELLSDATKDLYEFIPNLPLGSKDKVFEMIHYGVYYNLRKESLGERERYLSMLSEKYLEWLGNKFKEIDSFNQQAGTNYTNFEQVSLPTKYRLDKMNEKERKIAKDFLQTWSYSESKT